MYYVCFARNTDTVSKRVTLRVHKIMCDLPLPTDVDECLLDTVNCHANAECKNTPGGYNCACNAGYTGDGLTCEGIE